MKKYQKLICVFAVTALVIGCCCFPASAATISGNSVKDVFKYPTSGICFENYPNGGDWTPIGEVDYIVSKAGTNTSYVYLPHWFNEYDAIRSRYYTLNFEFREPWTTTENEIIKFKGDLSIQYQLPEADAFVYAFTVSYVSEWNGGSTSGVLYKSGAISSYRGTYPVDVTSKTRSNETITGIKVEVCVISKPNAYYSAIYSFGWENDKVTVRHGTADAVTQEIQNDKTNETLGNILEVQEDTNVLIEDVKDNQEDIKKRLDQMTAEQEKTNDKLDDLNDKQDETNKHLGVITDDKYNPPSGKDEMGELAEKEEAVNQSAQEGMNEAGNMFKAFSLDFFTDGLGAVVQIYNRIIPKIPWLNQLLMVSLALGLFSFLVGMAQAYIGRLNSNDRQARTEQYRQARLRQARRGN